MKLFKFASKYRALSCSGLILALFSFFVVVSNQDVFASQVLAQNVPFNQQPAVNQQPPVNQPNPNMGIPNFGKGPIVAQPISFVDVNTGKFGKLEIDLEDGQFLDGNCKNIHLIARDMDLREGLLKSLDISMIQGNYRDFIVDNMKISTSGSLRFDTGVLFNKKTLQFIEPAEADVEVEISQKSLNSFIKAPGTLDKFAFSASKKVGAIASMFGAKLPQIGLQITDGSLKLGKKNSVNIKLDSKVGMGEMAMEIPVEVDSVLKLEDGWVKVTDTHLKTSGKEISPQLSNLIVQKVNGLASLGTKSNDIHFKFTSLKVKPNKYFIVKGKAQINRLRFGR